MSVNLSSNFRRTTSRKAFIERAGISASSKSARVDIRITPEARQLLQEAAKERHTTVSQFVLESALNSAGAVPAGRSRLRLDAGKWAAFMDALDAPPRRHPRLEHLLNKASVLD